jgi:hypothetical protein
LGTTEKEISDITHNQNINQLRHIYDHQKYLTPENQRYLLNTVTAHSHQSKVQLNTWMKLHQQSMKKEIQQHITNTGIKESKSDQDMIPCEADVEIMEVPMPQHNIDSM